jgi:hypothetical protein
MVVVRHRLQAKSVYRLGIMWQGRVQWQNAGNDRREASLLAVRRKQQIKGGTYSTPSRDPR